MSERVETAADIDRMKADLAKLKEDLARTLATAAELGKDGAHASREALNRAAKYAKERGGEVVEDAQDRIRERPLTSVTIAFGVGLLLGALLDRRLR